jgi:hypothetical protein
MFSFFAYSSATIALGQAVQTKEEKQTAKVKARIRKAGSGDRSRIKVKLYNETRYQDVIREANENDFVIVDKLGNPYTVKYSDVKSINGKSLSTGAKIGIGIGIGVVAVFGVLAILFAGLND